MERNRNRENCCHWYFISFRPPFLFHHPLSISASCTLRGKDWLSVSNSQRKRGANQRKNLTDGRRSKRACRLTKPRAVQALCYFAAGCRLDTCRRVWAPPWRISVHPLISVASFLHYFCSPMILIYILCLLKGNHRLASDAGSDSSGSWAVAPI